MKRTHTVLLIEDHPDLRSLFALQISAMGYHVISHADGLSALQYLSGTEALPSCVLTDYRLPDTTGRTIIETIRHAPRTATLPTILMSADQEVVLIARVAGADASLGKPFSIEQLQECLHTVIHRVAEVNVTSHVVGVR